MNNQPQETMRRQRTIAHMRWWWLATSAALAALLAAFSLRDGVQRTIGSLHYEQQPMRAEFLPEAAHPRQHYWQAVVALGAGAPEQALTLAMPLATP